MSFGLIGLLDDIAAIAKVAAASLDDVASQAAKAGAKAAGVVIDDTAVTPGYVIGFRAEARASHCRQDRGGIAAQQAPDPAARRPGAELLPALTITPLLMLAAPISATKGWKRCSRPDAPSGPSA
jgi:hypothetical protein